MYNKFKRGTVGLKLRQNRCINIKNKDLAWLAKKPTFGFYLL